MGEHEADDAAAAEEGLLGATDIVEAFTALRHELKLQVRAGRELTGGLGQVLAAAVESPLAVVAQRLGDLEAAVETAGRSPGRGGGEAGDGDAAMRALATAVAETEESLARAAAALAAQAETLRAATTVDRNRADTAASSVAAPFAEAWDACLAESSWLPRWLSGSLLVRLRRAAEEAVGQAFQAGAQQAAEAYGDVGPALADAAQGLELVLLRVRRLMEQTGLARMDVLGQPFDPEWMRAVESVEADGVPPGAVAEEVRPGYVLSGTVLRPADVRVARSDI